MSSYTLNWTITIEIQPHVCQQIFIEATNEMEKYVFFIVS